MPSDVKITNTGSVFQSGSDLSTTGANASDTLYVSPPNKLTYQGGRSAGPSSTLEYVTVFNPETKTTDIYQQEYTSPIFGTPKPLDPTKKIATRNANGVYEPTEYATETLPSTMINKITRDGGSGQASLEANRKYLIDKSYQQNNNTTNNPPPKEFEKLSGDTGSAEDATPTNPDAAGANPGEGNDGSLAATSFDSAENQDTVSSFGGKKIFKYPTDARGVDSDYIKFTTLTYNPSTFGSGTNFGVEYTPGTIDEKSMTAYLPIQGGISDTNTVGWNEETMSPLQAFGAGVATEAIGTGLGAGVDRAMESIKGLKETGGEVKKALTAAFASQAIGANILPRTERSVFNPNTELLFQGPQLRAFSFQFKLTPRSEKEANEIKAIIKMFKFTMSPQTSTSALFLKAPRIFRIEYIHRENNDPHDGINLIKDCALQSMNVNYTPDGTYMSFKDGSMFSYDINLQFMELVPVYAKDYNEGSSKNHSIGY